MHEVDVIDAKWALLGDFVGRGDVQKILGSFNCTLEGLIDSLKGKHTWEEEGKPQANLAKYLESELDSYFTSKGLISTTDQNSDLVRCSDVVQYKSDVVAHLSGKSESRIICEIEMRPNFEKDMVKFQIANKNNLLHLAVLIVVLDRKKINPGYGTMPEYALVKEKIVEFSPDFPVLLLGLELSTLMSS